MKHWTCPATTTIPPTLPGFYLESIEERFRTMKPDKFLYFYQVAYPARDNVKGQYLNMNRPGSIIMDVLRLVIVLWGFMKFLIFTGPFICVSKTICTWCTSAFKYINLRAFPESEKYK